MLQIWRCKSLFKPWKYSEAPKVPAFSSLAKEDKCFSFLQISIFFPHKGKTKMGKTQPMSYFSQCLQKSQKRPSKCSFLVTLTQSSPEDEMHFGYLQGKQRQALTCRSPRLISE